MEQLPLQFRFLVISKSSGQLMDKLRKKVFVHLRIDFGEMYKAVQQFVEKVLEDTTKRFLEKFWLVL